MSRVETALEELIAAVIASEEYREYDRQKQIMKDATGIKSPDRPVPAGKF